MDFSVGEVVICVKSGRDAPNPWHSSNPLTVGAEYTILKVMPVYHANGTRHPDQYAVDNSGRMWTGQYFRRKEEGRKTDISFAYEILRKVTTRRPKIAQKEHT